jgi:hypothetical protein
LVQALDYGSKLAELSVLITAKKFNTRIALSGEQLQAVDVLSKPSVKGTVTVNYRYDFKEVKASLRSLRLERRMKALSKA